VGNDGAVLTFGQGDTHLCWAREVQQALLLFGIRSGLNVYPELRINLRVIKRDMPRFSEEIGFMNKSKQIKAASVRACSPQFSVAYGAGQRVKKLEITDEWAEMYDVINSESGQFMANGMIVHNSGADMLKLVMGAGYDETGAPYLWHILPKYNAYLLNTVYDEILVECPEERADELKDIIKERMIKAAETFVKKIPFDVEITIDKKWRKK